MPDLRQQLQATLSGSYTLDRELTGGGMSRVFLATETRLHRAVVVKVLSSEMAAGVSAERFEREIQLAASLQQANIVPLLSAGETQGIPYYTMPYVEGESLRARLATGARFSIAECASILRDVSRALSYAHVHGVVHRDIKPDNILLSHGTAVVTDFGIAKAISAARTQGGGATLTQAGTSIGTPAYMAPEQVAGDSTDPRVDLYAFGCVAYELLTGQPPFGGESTQRVLAAQISATARPVRELRSDMPPSLAMLVMRCLEKDAANRPASADDVLRSLEVAVTTSGGFDGMSPSRGKWRWAAVLGTAALMVLGAVLTFTSKGKAAATPDHSIAVLPLANLSGDQNNDYFGEGLAEEITGALAKGGIRVVGRGSARALASRGLDTRAIARELNVATVLQGTVQRAGDQVRISVTLASGSDGIVLWTNRYDRKLKDIFAVQDEIARSVVAELRTKLGGVVPDSGRQLVRNETSDPEAHSLYLRGLYLWNRRNAPQIHEAIRLFEQAVKRDPNYARAYAGIALANVVLPFFEDIVTDSLANRGRAAARRALAIDSTLSEGWTALAWANAYQSRNAEALADFSHAIRLDSTFATARFWHGLLLSHLGQYDDADREFARARELEPASLIIRTGGTSSIVARRQLDKADAAARQILATDSTFPVARQLLALIADLRGNYDEAIGILKSTNAGQGLRQSEMQSALALVYAHAGRTADARRVIDSLRSSGGGRLPPTGALAAALMALGDRVAAISVLQDAIERHDPWLFNYSKTARYDQLRKDPRGRALLAATELP